MHYTVCHPNTVLNVLTNLFRCYFFKSSVIHLCYLYKPGKITYYKLLMNQINGLINLVFTFYTKLCFSRLYWRLGKLIQRE